MDWRTSGILLHVTALPSQFGIGDLGPRARRFADLLAGARQKLWQILPLGPTEVGYGNSPYHSLSAFAFNTALVSPELLAESNWLGLSDLGDPVSFRPERVDYPSVIAGKTALLKKAYSNLASSRELSDFEAFCAEEAWWLEDFAVFMALKEHFGGSSWDRWPPGLRDRHPREIADVKIMLADTIGYVRFGQYVAVKQWRALKDYSNRKGIQVIGDVPIYIVHDSADVWANPRLFDLDENHRPRVVAGVPPDYFSKTGQLWGNPLYRWDVMKDDGFAWWGKRIEHSLRHYDLLRLDHFRGFVGYWEVPGSATIASEGCWRTAPGGELFQKVKERFNKLPFIAEDLGVITSDVKEVMARFGFPGMKVLLFAFDEDDQKHPYLPHNYESSCVAYTGTHDNNTARGWFDEEATGEAKQRLMAYLGSNVKPEQVPWAMIRLVLKSVAGRAVIPMQDVLGLGSDARFNRPGVAFGNWEWRLTNAQLEGREWDRLGELTESCGRA